MFNVPVGFLQWNSNEAYFDSREEWEEREEISGHLNELGWTWEFGRNASGHCEAFMVTSQQPLFCTDTERFVLSQWRTMILQQEPFTFWLILLTDSSLTLCQVQSSQLGLTININFGHAKSSSQRNAGILNFAKLWFQNKISFDQN